MAWALAIGGVIGLTPGGVLAQMVLPAGFTSRVYVSGEGYGREPGGAARGIPVATTLALDAHGALYLARSGNRYSQTEHDDLGLVYRVPAGGAHLTPTDEARFAHGPPLRNPEVGMVDRGGALYVTTYDRERAIGVVYRMRGERPVLFAGGTPPPGAEPVLRQAEGVAVDGAGHVYVADRREGRVVKLDPAGGLVDPAYLRVARARMVAIDADGVLWAAGDGTAERPWQEGVGQIWRVPPAGGAVLVREGPQPAAIAPGPQGMLFLGYRNTGRIAVLTPDGREVEFARFQAESGPRGLAFAPDTPETRQAGVAGDLFVVTMVTRTWYVNEVVRVTGPFAEFIRGQTPRP